MRSYKLEIELGYYEWVHELGIASFSGEFMVNYSIEFNEIKVDDICFCLGKLSLTEEKCRDNDNVPFYISGYRVYAQKKDVDKIFEHVEKYFFGKIDVNDIIAEELENYYD